MSGYKHLAKTILFLLGSVPGFTGIVHAKSPTGSDKFGQGRKPRGDTVFHSQSSRRAAKRW